MKNSDYVLRSFINASGTLAYISLIAFFGFNSKHIFGGEESFLIPMFMLLLFVISASITGLLVLGKPIHLYLSNLKKEAFTLLFATLAWLVIFLSVIIIVLVLR